MAYGIIYTLFIHRTYELQHRNDDSKLRPFLAHTDDAPILNN